MNRRTLLTLPLVAAFPTAPVATNILDGMITIPSDGDPAIAEGVNQALRELMESSKVALEPGAIRIYVGAHPFDAAAFSELAGRPFRDARGGT